MTRAAWLLAAALLAQAPAFSETGAAEHQAHHPAAAASQPAMPDASGPEEASAGAMPAMRDMMEHEGSSRRDTVYPRIVGTRLTDAQRVELREQARQRVHSGEELLRQAHAHLVRAMDSGDHGAAQAALVQAREAIGRVGSGVSAHKLALDDTGNAPQAVLDWLRTDLGLGSDPAAAHGLFGLTWFHYLLMAAVLASALLLAALQWHKRSRTTEVLEQLARRDVSAQTGLPAKEAADAAFRAPGQVQAPAPAPAAEARKANAWTGPLVVTRIFDEVPGVKTFRLADPAGGNLPFRYLPGQFLTLTVPGPAADQMVKRSYTIASSPAQSVYCEITVRHEPGGIVSGYLHERVDLGAHLQVTAASGRFTFAGEDADSIVLIAGGVGITPMMGVIRYLADRSWRGEIFLVYGCKTDDGFIFRAEIEHFMRRHPNLHVTFVAEQAVPERWPYATGRITPELLSTCVPQITRRHVHLCGPKPMMDAVMQMLTQLGVPAGQVETEVFQGKERPMPAPLPPSAATTVQATFARSGRSAPLPRTKTILEAAEDVGVDIEYSCRSGVCGICKVKLLSGEVTMDVEDGLTQNDRDQHMILACQARASTNVTVDA